MSKYGRTKSDVLKLISERKDTLSVISSELGLAPSTVSKHISELQELGAIKLIESEYAKKWKHYEINSDFKGEFPETIAAKVNFKNNSTRSKYAFAILLILAVIAGLFAFMSTYQNANGQVPIAITDPPYLPAGTTALNISYSSLTLNYSYGGVNRTETVNASGSFDAMKLINVTKIIAMANLKYGSKINTISINISSGTITIGNSTYHLTIPLKHFSMNIIGNNTVNSSSAVLIDMSSIVVPYYNGSSSSQLFAFLPKLSGMFGSELHPNSLPNMKILDNAPQANLTMPIADYHTIFPSFIQDTDDVDVSNVVISQYNSSESLSFSILNNGNSTEEIDGIAVLDCNPNVAYYKMQNNSNHMGSIVTPVSKLYSKNYTKNGTLTINVSRIPMNGSQKLILKINGTNQIPIHKIIITGNPFTHSIGNSTPIQIFGMAFGVLKNGNLSISEWQMPEISENNGYPLAPGNSKVFKYTSENGSIARNILYHISNSGSYKLAILTSTGIKIYTSNPSDANCDS